MHHIAVLSNRDEVNRTIREVCTHFADDFEPVFLVDEESFVQYLNYELPEIDIVLHSSDYVDLDNTFNVIKNDPWLHFGGSIVLYEDELEQDLLERFRGVNIIALIPLHRLSEYLERVLSVLSRNREILFQRDIHALLQSNLSGEFAMENDPFDVATYANLMANFLYNSNLLTLDEKYNFNTALMELLVNAIEHGNCQIDFDEKSAFLADRGDIMELIREKNKEPEIAKRKIHLAYRITPAESQFTIRDEGDGFDWREFLAKPPEIDHTRMHGRGINIARHYLKDVQYNDRGNEVSFSAVHVQNEANAVPLAFTDHEELTFKPGDTVFQQGEKSSYLYYIISGRFEIYAHDKLISTLTPADIFLGEMSFLLNNKRSATVIAASDASVIKISKVDFINAIRKDPHYGIFLARLLAQRLDSLHEVKI